MNRPFDCITDFVFVNQEPEKADIILVPGGRHPQIMTKAVELFKSGYAPYILPSGGKNTKRPEWESEWQYFKDMAVQAGIEEQYILKEDSAEHTFDNAGLSWKAVQDKGLKINQAILVTKSQHSRRALLTYQTEFPESVEFVVCSTADGLDILPDNWFLEQKKIDKVMEEVEKIGKYFGKHISKWV